MSDQVPYAIDEGIFKEPSDIFVNNPEPRCPCVLVLDVSGSMAGKPISELNAGLTQLHDELVADELAAKRVEVAIVTFGPVEVSLNFTGAQSFRPPALTSKGDTPMGAALARALDMVEERKHVYRVNGINYYRPWIFLVTDGAPTDSVEAVTARLAEGEERGRFAFFAVGVQGARMDILNGLAKRGALKLDGLRFRDLFAWLSTSLKGVSHSGIGDKVALPPPGWTSV